MAARRFAGAATLLGLFVVLLAARSCAGRDFYVGGRGGWAPNPAEPFNAWAERNRFQVNDTLVFRYNKDGDAVALVSPSHYDACNATQPILRLDGGDSRFVFDASGPYFFIGADPARCRAGQRLIVVVLAVRDGGSSSASSSSPPPLSPPPPKPSSSTPPQQPPKSSPPSLTPPPPPPPPPVATPTPRPSSPTPTPQLPPAPGSNALSPYPAPVPAPTPVNNATSPPPSSAAALRAGVLSCLMIGGAALLV
ncbi:hypothetical protein U9M48_021133 [Paspalum notatum var. saurae]|uniref:Phytocyanin domain-containing protein n=1 Tax=Paspalum notatum var. saurae TaxID=547442 RepID=A0AAQ3WTA4_PASNO